jgi:hypothetical protein
MENNNHEHHDNEHGCCHGYMNHQGRIVAKIVMALVIAGLVCMAIFGFGRWGYGGMMGYRGYNHGPYNMMGGYYYGDGNGYKEAKNREKLIGTITSIEINKIVITDNAAKEQVVLSQSDTSILTTTGATTLGGLKVGQNIVAVGKLNATNQLEATAIQVLQ